MPIVKVNDIHIYYEIHGEGEPLVLIAGLSTDITGSPNHCILDRNGVHYPMVAQGREWAYTGKSANGYGCQTESAR